MECAEAIMVADGISWFGEEEDMVQILGLSRLRL
jgi:hypothetical protein